MKADKVFIGGWFVMLLLNLAIWGGIIFVAIHFLAKVW